MQHSHPHSAISGWNKRRQTQVPHTKLMGHSYHADESAPSSLSSCCNRRPRGPSNTFCGCASDSLKQASAWLIVACKMSTEFSCLQVYCSDKRFQEKVGLFYCTSFCERTTVGKNKNLGGRGPLLVQSVVGTLDT